MIKFIFTDMDGTLIGKNQEISRENRDAILKAQMSGIKVVAATGRSYNHTVQAFQKAGLQVPMICMNGALLVNESGEELSQTIIQAEKVKAISNILDSFNIYYEIYTNKGHFSSKKDMALKSIATIMYNFSDKKISYEEFEKSLEKRAYTSQIKFVESFNKIFDITGIQFYKFLAFPNDKEISNQIRKKLEEIEDIAVSSSGFNNIEINDKNATKGIALETFTKMYSSHPKEAMAIGDSYNDLSMLKVAGFSVAMGNAPKDIQAIAHFVTLKFDEHGFAKAVEKVLQINAEENLNI